MVRPLRPRSRSGLDHSPPSRRNSDRDSEGTPRLAVLAFYLKERGLTHAQVAEVLVKQPDTLRKNRYFERGRWGEAGLDCRSGPPSDPIFRPTTVTPYH